MKRGLMFSGIFLFLFANIFFVSAALNVTLSDQGSNVISKSTGLALTSGDLSVYIYDAASGGNLVYSENFTNGIANGSWNMILGENNSNPLSLEFGKAYYKDYYINAQNLDFTNFAGTTSDRQLFYSPLGDIAGNYIQQNANLTIYNLSASGSVSASNFLGNLSGYPATYFFPLNTSVTGTFDFNGNWQDGGLTIQQGAIYAQAGYFYNISSLQINRLEVNGSLFPYPGYSNIFDIGNSSLLWNDLWLGGNANVSGDVFASRLIGNLDYSNITNPFNFTFETFNTFNSTWDNRYLIADVSTALSNNITSVNNTKNIQEILNSTGIYSPFPSGMVSFFKLSACPTGWTQDPDSVGRYVVGANSSYTINATGGTALTNNENRTVGQHSHGITDPAHTHNPPEGSSAFLVQQGGVANYAGGGNPVNPGAGLTGPASTGVTINNEGSVAGTNAPYIQYLVCVKD